MRLLRCRGAIFGVSDEFVESRVPTKRFEIGIIFHRKILTGRQSMVDRLPQVLERLATLSLVKRKRS